MKQLNVGVYYFLAFVGDIMDLNFVQYFLYMRVLSSRPIEEKSSLTLWGDKTQLVLFVLKIVLWSNEDVFPWILVASTLIFPGRTRVNDIIHKPLPFSHDIIHKHFDNLKARYKNPKSQSVCLLFCFFSLIFSFCIVEPSTSSVWGRVVVISSC